MGIAQDRQDKLDLLRAPIARPRGIDMSTYNDGSSYDPIKPLHSSPTTTIRYEPSHPSKPTHDSVSTPGSSSVGANGGHLLDQYRLPSLAATFSAATTSPMMHSPSPKSHHWGSGSNDHSNRASYGSHLASTSRAGAGGGAAGGEGHGSDDEMRGGAGADSGRDRDASEAPSGNGGPGGNKKRKRARVVLSCTMCVRRKTKCDKVVPCSACVKRGSPHDCVVEGVEDVASQPFALNEELVALRSRVTTLEGLVNTLLTNAARSPAPPSSLTQGAIASPGMSSTAGQTPHHKTENEEVHVVEALQRLREGSSDGRSPFNVGVATNHFRSSGAPDLDALLALIPDKTVCDLLLESYLQRVDWQLHILHIPTLKHDYRTMWDKLRSPAPATGPESLESWVPPRLGTFFMVIALGLHFIPPELSPYSAVEAAAMPTKWLDAAEKALIFADWSGRPQLRTIQTILLMSQLWHHIGEIDRFVIWIGAGVRVAQSLGLHTAEQTGVLHLPHDEFPVKSYARDFYCRELGKRVWWALCADDWDVSYRTRNVSVLRTQDFSTPSPFNLTDDDLMGGPVASRSLTQPTSVTFQICHSDLIYLSQQWRQPHREMGNIGNLSVETVISLDEIVRGMSVRFPFYLQLEKRDDPAVRSLEQSHPLVAIQRLHLAKELHCRFIRLHRRALFGDDLGAAQARVSRATLRSSASTLLAIVCEIRSKTDYAHKLWWVNSYMILSAVAMLFSNIQLLTSTPAPVPNSVLGDAASKRHEVLTTVTLTRSTPPLNSHTLQGLRVIELLLQEENVIVANVKRSMSAGRGLSDRDAERYYAAMDVVAKATMCVAERETLRLKDLADHWNDFEPRPNPTDPNFTQVQQRQQMQQLAQGPQVGQLIPPANPSLQVNGSATATTPTPRNSTIPTSLGSLLSGIPSRSSMSAESMPSMSNPATPSSLSYATSTVTAPTPTSTSTLTTSASAPNLTATAGGFTTPSTPQQQPFSALPLTPGGLSYGGEFLGQGDQWDDFFRSLGFAPPPQPLGGPLDNPAVGGGYDTAGIDHFNLTLANAGNAAQPSSGTAGGGAWGS